MAMKQRFIQPLINDVPYVYVSPNDMLSNTEHDHLGHLTRRFVFTCPSIASSFSLSDFTGRDDLHQFHFHSVDLWLCGICGLTITHHLISQLERRIVMLSVFVIILYDLEQYITRPDSMISYERLFCVFLGIFLQMSSKINNDFPCTKPVFGNKDYFFNNKKSVVT